MRVSKVAIFVYVIIRPLRNSNIKLIIYVFFYNLNDNLPLSIQFLKNAGILQE